MRVSHANSARRYGQPVALPTLRRARSHFFARFTPEEDSWLDEQANTVLGMVAADATEVHIVGYLRTVMKEIGSPKREPDGARPAAVALWHIEGRSRETLRGGRASRRPAGEQTEPRYV